MLLSFVHNLGRSYFSLIVDKLNEAAKLAELKDQIRIERRELQQLDERMLKDIGKSPEEAIQEANRGYADIPAKRLAHLQDETPVEAGTPSILNKCIHCES